MVKKNNKNKNRIKEHQNIYIHVKKKSVNNFFGTFLFLAVLSISILMMSAPWGIPENIETIHHNIGISTYEYVSLIVTSIIALFGGFFLFLYCFWSLNVCGGDFDGFFKGEYK